VRKLTNLGGTTTGDIRRGTRASWESRETILTDVYGVHTESLLETTDGGNVGTYTETWTDELLLNGTQVIHPTLIIHTIAHV
jgi:hypothetical protein